MGKSTPSVAYVTERAAMSTNSSSPPADLRVRRTRKLLSDALVTLLAEQPFESITVRQICDRAMVHRATFYTHFTDKYELLRSVLNDVQADLLQIQRGKEQRADNDQFHLREFIDYVTAHRSLFSLLLIDKETDSLTALMRHQIAALTEAQVKEYQASGVRYSVPPTVMAQFFAGAVFGVIAWWLEHNQPISADQLTHYLDHLLSKQYEGPGAV
jgi:AcrR family transcriptional regulator